MPRVVIVIDLLASLLIASVPTPSPSPSPSPQPTAHHWICNYAWEVVCWPIATPTPKASPR